MKLAHRLVQTAGQLRHCLRAHYFARQNAHHPPRLPGAEAAQKCLPDQHRHLLRPPLKRFQPARQKALPTGTRHPQPEGAEASHEIALVVAVAVGLPPVPSPLIGLPHRKAVPLPLRVSLEKLFPRQLRLPIQIPPETFFHLCQKMLEMLRDWDYLRHRV